MYCSISGVFALFFSHMAKLVHIGSNNSIKVDLKVELAWKIKAQMKLVTIQPHAMVEC